MKSAVITGSLSFPIDMLRYDGCVPASEQDSQMIGDTFMSSKSKKLRNWSITVKKTNSNPFSVGRWQSFGCDIQPQ